MTYRIANLVPLNGNNAYTLAVYAFFNETGEEGVINLCVEATTCTDYLTDKLMYPSRPFGLRQYMEPDLSSLKLAVGFCKKVYADQFMAYGVPLINKIEKRNRIKPTKYVQQGNNVFITGDAGWYRSTFHLSLYTKFIRNFCVLKKPVHTVDDIISGIIKGKDYPDLTNRDILKIVFGGKINKVNRYCRYKHGYTKARRGDHSNNGIRATVRYAHLIKNPGAIMNWEKHTLLLIKDFKRGLNFNKILEELKDFNPNALPSL